MRFEFLSFIPYETSFPCYVRTIHARKNEKEFLEGRDEVLAFQGLIIVLCTRSIDTAVVLRTTSPYY